MKKLRGLFVVILTILISLSFTGISSVHAAGEKLSVKVYKNTNSRETGLYKVNNGGTVSGQTQAEVFKLVAKDGNGGASDNDAYSATNANRMIYCMYQGVGLGVDSSYNKVYDLHYNMKEEINASHLGRLPREEDTYNKLVWVLNNIVDPYDDDAVNEIYNKIVEKYNLQGRMCDFNYLKNQTEGDVKYKFIDAFETAQQAAVWRYTNFNSANYSPNFKVGQNSYRDLNYYSGMFNPYEYLYRYLVDEADKAVQNGYTYNQKEEQAVEITGESITDDITSDSYYIVGPIQITNPDLLNDFKIKVTIGNSEQTITNSVYVYNKNKEGIGTGNTLAKIKNLAENGVSKFYLGIPKVEHTKGYLISGIYNKTIRNITYWTTESDITNTQPVAVIKNTTKEFEAKKEFDITPHNIDLALRKWITQINGQDVESREPEVTDTDVVNLAKRINGFTTVDTPDCYTTSVKKHTKKPIAVHAGDIITYKIRVYNEGDTDVTGIAITDQITSNLEFVTDSTEFQNNWTLYDGHSNVAVHVKNVTIGKFFEDGKQELTYKASDLKHYDVEIKCRVKSTATYRSLLKNIAEISMASTADSQITKDIDSTFNNIADYVEDYKNYNPVSAEEGKGYEDDDDYERLYIPKPESFDLALRKYITKVNGTAVTSREPEITEEYKQQFVNNTGKFATTIEKDHTKDPVVVEKGDIVTYTIRVYNEGGVNGKATEITDYLPEGLTLATASEDTEGINATYGWVADSTDSKIIKTTYLNNRILNAFNKSTLALDYADVQVVCKVNDNATAENLRNIAEITADDNEDIDSTVKNVNRNSYSPKNPTIGHGEEDDDDYEDLRLRPTPGFDLALRKYIVSVTSNGTTTPTNRVTDNIDKSKLNVSSTTAEYKHAKDAIEVKAGDTIKYRIATFNESEQKGYVYSIKDYLPQYLEFVPDARFAKEGEATSSTEYIYSFDETNNLLTITNYTEVQAIGPGNYLWSLNAYDGATLDSKYIEFDCRVKSNYAPAEDTYLTNVATMTYSNKGGSTADPVIPDRDSSEDNLNVPGQNILVNTSETAYIGNSSNKTYLGDTEYHYKGQEDDDDFEKVLVRAQVNPKFDLALRKFITGVNNEKITDREPNISQSALEKLAKGEARFDDGTTVTKTHTKAPIQIRKGYNVIYTIRVYNEGDVDGTATEITDYLPEGLSLAKNSTINTKYGWTADSQDSKKVTTTYLRDKNIKAFSKEKNREGKYEIFYEDVEIECTVNNDITPTTKLRNIAEITDDNNDDRDSTPKNLTESQRKDYKPGTSEDGKGYEDDDDYEDLSVYDLALRKWVTTAIVIEDNVKKIMYTGHKAEDDPESIVKVEVNDKRIKSAEIKFVYSIRITNEGNVDGICEEITDYIPDGLKFVKEDNPDWTQDSSDSAIIRTEKLKNTTLKPGESAEVEVALTWINDENNMGVKINTAEISKDDGLDIDSEPNNKVEGEDDIDTAPVALTVVTGSAPLYTSLVAGILFILGAGIVVIKKVVL